ncbi:hypothetical protein M8J77_025392 [Diaphorina citri]|nr:hypothetical protein M8J77_025392 [Diaphorina citri]
MLPRVVSRGSSELVVFSPGGVFFDDIKYFIAVNPFGENAISFDCHGLPIKVLTLINANEVAVKLAKLWEQTIQEHFDGPDTESEVLDARALPISIEVYRSFEKIITSKNRHIQFESYYYPNAYSFRMYVCAHYSVLVSIFWMRSTSTWSACNNIVILQ